MFEKYCRKGTCDVCGKETDVVVCASTMGAISFAYCKECIQEHLEPYDAMVAYISCSGHFPQDINETDQKYCRHVLNKLGISEEQFINDVDEAIEVYNKQFSEIE